jgi:hypothetical protein
MTDTRLHLVFRRTLGIMGVLLLLVFPAGWLFAQGPEPPAQPPAAAQLFSPDQLDTLVAPVALYPDALLSQVLVASTYPLEVAEAAQWLQQNRNLQGQQLMDAARQQNWDPSSRLSSDIRWMTDLGNAFLAQQADVMNAVQRLRAHARAAGKLDSNAQETVTTRTQGDRNVIEIQPANPEIVYVPSYNPEYIWGAPAYGYYPPLYYPDYGYGFGYGPGIYIGGFFGGLGWGGWGWGPNWFDCTIFQNGNFFNRYGFYGRGGFGGGGIWAHNPAHRGGVAYPNRGLAARYGGAGGGLAGGRLGGPSSRTNPTNFANRGNVGVNGAQRSAAAGGTNRFPSAQSRPGGQSLGPQGGRAQAGNGQRFSGPGAAASQGQRGAPAARQSMNAAPASGSGGSQWRRFGDSGSQPSYRSTPSYGGGSGYRAAPSYGGSFGGSRSVQSYRSSPAPSYGGGSAYRTAPSYGGSFGGSRSAPSYRSSPSYGGGYRAAPSYGGSFGGSRSAPSYRSSPAPSYGGGGYRSAPSYGGGSGGGGFHGGGGSSSRSSGGGSHGGRR